jgi:hypothetical protein
MRSMLMWPTAGMSTAVGTLASLLAVVFPGAPEARVMDPGQGQQGISGNAAPFYAPMLSMQPGTAANPQLLALLQGTPSLPPPRKGPKTRQSVPDCVLSMCVSLGVWRRLGTVFSRRPGHLYTGIVGVPGRDPFPLSPVFHPTARCLASRNLAPICQQGPWAHGPSGQGLPAAMAYSHAIPSFAGSTPLPAMSPQGVGIPAVPSRALLAWANKGLLPLHSSGSCQLCCPVC